MKQVNLKKLAMISSVSLSVVFGAPLAHAEQFVNIATGGTTGVMYALGVALSKIYVQADPTLKPSVQATKASVENMNLLQQGRTEVAFSLADAASDAWNGVADGGFPKKLDKIRGVASIYHNYVHFFTKADSQINSLADLKGKRVGVGAPKSGTELNTRAILAANGIKYSDLARVDYLGYLEAVQSVQDGRIDVGMISSGMGVATLRELASNTNIRFIPVTPEEVAKINNPVYEAGVIPAGVYKGIDKPVPTAIIGVILTTHAGVSDDLVYMMTKSMWENRQLMVDTQSAADEMDLKKAMKGMAMPIHPGALRYYKEKGLSK